VPEPTVPAAPEGERRSCPRYRIVRRCLVTPQGGNAADQGWHCVAYDISSKGLGLSVPLPFRVGTLLTIEAIGLPGMRPLRVRVAHVRPVAYVWFCGCEFGEPLREDELRTWVERPRG
jgi:hypothetical protein